MSRDPIEEDGGLNIFGYVGNRPVFVVDAFGLRGNDVPPSVSSPVSMYDFDESYDGLLIHSRIVRPIRGVGIHASAEWNKAGQDSYPIVNWDGEKQGSIPGISYNSEFGWNYLSQVAQTVPNDISFWRGRSFHRGWDLQWSSALHMETRVKCCFAPKSLIVEYSFTGGIIWANRSTVARVTSSTFTSVHFDPVHIDGSVNNGFTHSVQNKRVRFVPDATGQVVFENDLALTSYEDWDNAGTRLFGFVTWTMSCR